ncbi:MAG: Plug domain-containing protein, partial [Deltaproteobacteria bacterium]|nr:Plug domain-containing protein [Deltaproteobacteria bacterium]
MNDYRKHLVVCLLATAIFLGFGQMAPVFAQESDILPEIDVRGALRREELTTTSATVIDNTEITDHVYSRSALDMLTLAPGVSMGNPMANGTTGFIYIRGMQGGHAGEINFYIDGIPISEGGHSSNYNDLGMIMPLEIESLEIVKGPASVNYGRNAAGGAVSFQTIKSGNFTRLVGRLGTMAMYDFSGIIAKDIGPINHI